MKPLNNGVAEFECALNGVRIKNASVSDLQAILRRAFILVGIRANNLPSPEETQILTAFIFKKYAALTLEEIQLAFEKAVAGELPIDDVSCYENFSPEYFGNIMTAYKKWATQVFNENQMYVIKPQENNLLTMAADWKELVDLNYQQFLTGTYKMEVWPWQMYDECVKAGYIESEAYQDFLNRALNLIKLTTPENNQQAEKRKEIIQAGINHPQVTEMAKRLSIKLLYITAKNKNYTHLFKKE